MNADELNKRVNELEFQKRNLEEKKSSLESNFSNVTDPYLTGILNRINNTTDINELIEIDRELTTKSNQLLEAIEMTEKGVGQVANIIK